MKKIVLLIGVSALLVACSDDEQAAITPTDDIKRYIEQISLDEVTVEAASINATQLQIDQQGDRTTHDLPTDEFFVSIAPYVTTTHPCTDHSLTGCQGELANEQFDVLIVDEDGNVLVDDQIATMNNGFMDLWLPREKTMIITITQGDKVAQGVMSTFAEDGTCITTLQLR